MSKLLKPQPPPTEDYKFLEAFEHYYDQGLADGERSLAVTAKAYDIPVSRLKRLAAKDKWGEKIAARDTKVREEMDKMVVASVAQLKLKLFRQCEVMLDTFFEAQFSTPEKAALTAQMMDTDSYVRLVKMALTQLGQPDAIKQIAGAITHD